MEESKLIEKITRIFRSKEKEKQLLKNEMERELMELSENYLITKFNKRVREFFRKYLEVSYNFLKHRDIQEVKMKN